MTRDSTQIKELQHSCKSLDKISPLRTSNKLGAVLIQLPPSFTVREFKNTEQFWTNFQVDMIMQLSLDILHGTQRRLASC